jgi:hypothetical protein
VILNVLESGSIVLWIVLSMYIFLAAQKYVLQLSWCSILSCLNLEIYLVLGKYFNRADTLSVKESNNRMYLCLHVKCPIFLPNYNQIWNSLTDVHKSPKCQILQMYVQWNMHWWVQTDMMKVVGIDCECVNMSKNYLIAVATNSMHKCQNLKLLGYLNFGLWKDFGSWLELVFWLCCNVTCSLMVQQAYAQIVLMLYISYTHMATKITLLCIPFVLNHNWIHLWKQISFDWIKCITHAGYWTSNLQHPRYESSLKGGSFVLSDH